MSDRDDPEADDFGDEAVEFLGDMLAMPIIALQEAQVRAEELAIEFVEEYGLQPHSLQQIREAKATGQPLPPRSAEMVTFRYPHRLPDPNDPSRTIETEAEVSVPLLALARPPAIRVDKADIEMTLDVAVEELLDVEEEPAPAPGGNRRSFLGKPTTRTMTARVTRNARNAARRNGKVSVKMSVRDASEDENMARLTRLLLERMTATAEVPASAPARDNIPNQQDGEPTS